MDAGTSILNTYCDRCQQVSPTSVVKALRLCFVCAALLTSPCEEYQHDYHGSRIPGHWVCYRCGETLVSTLITQESFQPNDAWC